MNLGLLTAGIHTDLKQKTVTQPYSQLWDYFVKRWESIAERVAELGTPFDISGIGAHSITPMAVEAAAIWRLTGRDDAKDYALLCINHLLKHYNGYPSPEDFVKGNSQKTGNPSPKPHSHPEVALSADILRDTLPQETLEAVKTLMKKTCIPYTFFEHGLAGYSSGGNISLGKNIDAAICALVWGKECGFENWESVVDNTCDAVRQYLRNGCDEDGFSYEGTGYGEQVMQFIFLFCHLLRQARWHDDLLKTEPRLRLIPDAYQQMLLPDSLFTATTNDAGSGCRAPMSLWWLLLAADEFHRPDYRGVWESFSGPDNPVRPWGDCWPYWAKISQTEPRCIEHMDKTMLMTFLYWNADAPTRPIEQSPLPTAVCAEGSGTATFRTSWNKDAIFAIMLGAGRSRACFGHAHSDCGHIGIAIGDEYLAVDSGRYNWPEDQHSVVMVDAQNAIPLPPGLGMGNDFLYGRLGEFQRHRMLDYCVADAAHMKNALWALRNFMFIRTSGDNGYIVLLDNINVDNKPHEYWWQLQCATTARIKLTSQTTATVHGSKARIECSFFHKADAPAPDCPHSIEVKQDIKEWVWPYGKNQDSKQVGVFERTGETITSVRRPRLLAVQKTGSGMLMSVLSPLHENEESRQIRQVPVTNGIGIEVSRDGITDTILSAPDHKLILTDKIKCFSEFAVIRRDTAGKVLDTWTQSGEPVQMI